MYAPETEFQMAASVSPGRARKYAAVDCTVGSVDRDQDAADHECGEQRQDGENGAAAHDVAKERIRAGNVGLC